VKLTYDELAVLTALSIANVQVRDNGKRIALVDADQVRSALEELMAQRTRNAKLEAVAETGTTARWHWEKCEEEGEGQCCYEVGRAFTRALDALASDTEAGT